MLAGWLAVWQAGRHVGRQAGWQTGWQTGWLAGCHAGREGGGAKPGNQQLVHEQKGHIPLIIGPTESYQSNTQEMINLMSMSYSRVIIGLCSLPDTF